MAEPWPCLRLWVGLLLFGACGRAEMTVQPAAGSGGTLGSIGMARAGAEAQVNDNRVESEAAGRGGAAGGRNTAQTSGAGAAGRAGTPAAGSGGSAGAAVGGAGGATAGAGGHDAGSGGSAGAVSAAPSGPSLCANPDLLFCENFEAASIDKSVWQTQTSAPALDGARAARGSKSLHVHTMAVGASGLQTSQFLSRAPGHYYGRLFIWFDALPTSPPWAHWTIVGANTASNASDKSEIRVGGQADGKSIERWGVGTDHGPTGDWTNLDDDPKGAPEPVPLKRWLCVEWLHDWTNDETRFYLNGAEHASLHTTRAVKHGANSSVAYDIPQIASLWIGFWNYDQGDGGSKVMPRQFDVWIDEVAFDDERIGCDK